VVKALAGSVMAGRSVVECSASGDYLLRANALPLLEGSSPRTRSRVAEWIREERRKRPNVLPEISEVVVLQARW
jgi:hypothetical protein